MRLVFYFSGTDEEASDKQEMFEEKLEMSDDFASDVIRVYVEGCQHKLVGNSSFNPDLTIASKKIVSAFLQCGVLDLSRLKNNFGDAIIICGPKVEGNITPITSVLLSGYSRGAVTTLFVAKALYACENTKDIPVDIIADQPVPGRFIGYSARGVSDAIDCTECVNIRYADVFIGSYGNDNGMVQNGWYGQMIPSFHKRTHATSTKLAITKHMEGGGVSCSHVANKIHHLKYCRSIENPYPRKIVDYYWSEGFCAFMPEGCEQNIFKLADNNVEIIPDIELLYDRYKNLLPCFFTRKQISVLNVNVKNREIVVKVLAVVDAESNALLEAMLKEAGSVEVPPKKYGLIRSHRHDYQASIIGAIAIYLNSHQQDSIESKTILMGCLKNAENIFCKNALNFDRNKKARMAMRILMNSLFLLCTGVLLGLAFNVMTSKRDSLTDKAFPFFSQTNSAARFSQVTSILLQHTILP